jgi:spore maturation protein SpmA
MIAITIAAGIVYVMVLGVTYQAQLAQWSPTALALNAVFSTLISAIWSVIQTSLFVELREWKEGPIEAKLGEIFE